MWCLRSPGFGSHLTWVLGIEPAPQEEQQELLYAGLSLQPLRLLSPTHAVLQGMISFIFDLSHVYKYFACMYVHAWSEEWIGSPETGVLDDCEPPSGCWD